MFRNDWLDILDPMLARQHIQNAAFDQGAPQQQAAPQPMQLPPAPPAFAPRPVRYNAPKRQPLIRMGSPLQTGFWGALSLLAPQLATGYLRGRQMSQEQEQQDAMLQYKAAMDEEQQRRQASQDEWDQWGKTANVELEKRRLDQADAKAQDPRTLRSKVVSQLIQQGRGVTPDVLAWSMNPDPEATMPQLGENVEGGRLWKAIQDAIAATQRNNTGLLSYTGNTNTQYVPGQAAPVVNPNPVPVTLSPGGRGDTNAASATNSRASAAFTQGPRTALTKAQTSNVAAQPADRDADRALRESIALANNAIRVMAANQAHADRQASIAARGSGGGRAPKAKKLTQTELVSVRARNSHVPPPVWKNLESVGIAPGPQALASAKFYASDAGGKVLKEDLNGVFSVDPAANPEYMAAFVKNQDEWKRGVHQWVNGRQIDARAPKPAAPKAAPKPAPANPMRAATGGMAPAEFQKLRGFVKKNGIDKDYLKAHGPKEYGQLSPAQMKALFG